MYSLYTTTFDAGGVEHKYTLMNVWAFRITLFSAEEKTVLLVVLTFPHTRANVL